MVAKARITGFFVFVMLVLIVSAGFAQTDTLIVYASKGNLNTAIQGDTTAQGARIHKVYRLVSTDTTYVYEETTTLNSDVTVIGVPAASTGRLPCIQPVPRSDNSLAANMFNLNGKGMKAVFKDVYFLGTPTNNALMGDGIAIQVTADSIRLEIDHCIFEEWLTFAIGYNGVNDKFFISNTVFRNMVHPNQWYIGEALRNMWPGEVATDSVVMRSNTFFCLNGYAACPVSKYYVSYFEFVNNSVIYTFKNPLFIFNVTKAKINNNLFYGAWAGGIAKPEYPWWDQLWTPEVGSIIDLDKLDSAKIKGWQGSSWASKPSAEIDTAAEKLRVIEVKNNAYFWPTAMTSFWTAWNDTATVDSVYTVTWMNTRTTNMFTDKTTWPGLVAEGNIAVDPGFGSSIDAVMNQTSNGLFDWFRVVRTNTASNTFWGYNRTVVGTALNWVPTWPLPEATDMQYTSASVKTGSTNGGIIGDPNWFGVTVSAEEALDPIPQRFELFAAYPNPFNPSTTIRYTLPEASRVQLGVYNMLGQLVRTLEDRVVPAGSHEVVFDASGLASGLYLYAIEIVPEGQGGNVVREMRKVVLLK